MRSLFWKRRTVICASRTAASVKKHQTYSCLIDGQALINSLKSVYAIPVQIRKTRLAAIVPNAGISEIQSSR